MKYIIDLDGTILDGERANKDSVEFMKTLQKRNLEFIIMTNSIRSPQKIAERLSSVKLSVDIDRILNPIRAINIYLKTESIKSAYIIGSQLEVEQVEVENRLDNPEIVILLDFEKENISYNEIQRVYTYINKGVPVITASKSTFYYKNGEKYLDTGAFVKLLEAVTEKRIKVFGKPSIEYFTAAITLLNTNSDNITVIGDDWSTDVLGANNAGCRSVLLRSCKYREGDELKCKPDMCVDNFSELIDA